jgi:hypothetical protein
MRKALDLWAEYKRLNAARKEAYRKALEALYTGADTERLISCLPWPSSWCVARRPIRETTPIFVAKRNPGSSPAFKRRKNAPSRYPGRAMAPACRMARGAPGSLLAVDPALLPPRRIAGVLRLTITILAKTSLESLVLFVAST